MQRLLCLDGLRGALAVYVMLGHMAPFAPMPESLARALSHGGAAVEMFFALSGLVIVRSLNGFGWRAGPFLAARAARIYPAYLAALALALAVHPLPFDFDLHPWIGPASPARRMWSRGWPDGGWIDLAAHLAMLHGLFPDGARPHAWVAILGPAWSLATEWQFYVLALLVGARRPRRLAWALIAIAAAGAAWAAWAPVDWRFSRAFLGNKAAYFALGVASAAIVRDGWARAGGYAAALATALVLGWIDGGAAKLGVPLAWTACLWLQTRAPGALPARLLSSRPMLWLGGVSYPLYLVNEPIQRALGWWIAGAEAWVFAAVWLPGATLGPIAAAAALAAWVERPAWRAGRAWAAGFANRDRRSARHGL